MNVSPYYIMGLLFLIALFLAGRAIRSVRNRKWRYTLAFLLAGVVAISCAWWILNWLFNAQQAAALVGMQRITKNTLEGMRKRIIVHYRDTGQVLQEWGADGGATAAPTDAWGNPVQVSVNDLTVVLISYGADGRPGGDGENEDITLSFDCRTAPIERSGPSDR